MTIIGFFIIISIFDIILNVGDTMARNKFQTLTEQMYYILIVLQNECCGVDIMEHIQDMTKGRIEIGPGTLYTLLAEFLKTGIIRETAVLGRKRSYIITDYGIELLWKEYERLNVLVEDYKKYEKN